MKKETTQSYRMLTASMLLFGTVDIFRRSILLSSEQSVFFCGVLGTAALWLYVIIRNKKRALPASKNKSGKANGKKAKRTGKAKKNTEQNQKGALLKLTAAGICIAVSRILLFEAYRFGSASAVSLCCYMAPAMVIFLSPLLLKERLTRRTGIAAAVCTAGMVLVSGISKSGWRQAGCRAVLLGLGAAVFYAAVIILNKKTPMEDIGKKTAIQVSAATAVFACRLLITHGFSAVAPAPAACVSLAVLGIIHTGLASLLYFGSMKELRGQSVALFSFVGPVFALFFSAVFLQEPLSPPGTLGTFLILGAAAVCEFGSPPHGITQPEKQ